MGSGDKSIQRFIEEMHGRHGGSPESEGKHQSENPDPATKPEWRRDEKEPSPQSDADAHRLSRELVRDHKPVRGDENR